MTKQDPMLWMEASRDSSESAGISSPNGSKRHYLHPLSLVFRLGRCELGNGLTLLKEECSSHAGFRWKKISDFDPAIRSAMNASIFFRTKYSGDLDAITKVLGSEFSKIATNVPVAYSIFHLADVGEPFVVAWRPTYAQS